MQGLVDELCRQTGMVIELSDFSYEEGEGADGSAS